MSEKINSVNKKMKRDRSIEMLRIFAMMGVIVMHYNNPGMGGGLFFVSGTANVVLLYLAESLAICAVNLFVIISGYFMCMQDGRKIRKTIELLVQALLFGAVMYGLRVVTKHEPISVQGLLDIWDPLYYYIVLYIAVYWISPYLNVGIRKLAEDEKALDKMIVVLIGIISVEPFLVDVLQVLLGKNLQGMSTIGLFGSQSGFTLIQFLLCYCVGAYIRLGKREWTMKQINVLFFVSLFFVWGGALAEKAFFGGSQFSFTFSSPFVLGEAVALLLYAVKKNEITKKAGEESKFLAKTGTVIETLAKASFTVYLFHIHLVTRIKVPEFVSANPFIMVVHLIGSCVVIYAICFVVWWIYEKVSKPVFDKLFDK